MDRRLLPSALALGALAAAAATPSAHAAWSPATTLARPAAESLAAAGNARRSEVFAWTVTTKRFVRMRSQTGFASFVRAKVRLPSGALGVARVISSRSEIVASPAVAIDAGGNATVVWTQAGRHIRVMGSYRSRGRRFGAPFEIGRSGAFHDARPAIAVASDGAAVIAWNGGSRLQVVRRPAGRCRAGRPRGCFGRPQSLARGTDQTVALSGGGTAIVVWAATVRRDDAVHAELRMTTAPRGRPFGPARSITRAGDASQPALAIAPDGSAIVAWRASPPAGGEQELDATILAAVRDGTGRLDGPRPVSRLPGSDPQLGVNAQGEAILAWNQADRSPQNPDGPEVAAAVRPVSGGGFAAPVTISPAGAAAGSASLAVDATGTAILVFSAAAIGPDFVAGPVVALSHRKPPGAAFGGPEPLPAGFTGAFVFAAGTRVTAASGGGGGRTLISDFAA